MDRLDALRDLVAFSEPVDVLSINLSKFDWDYDGQPLIVAASQIRNVLERFLAGEYTAADLEGWANLVECREDLEFEGQKHEPIKNIIHCLANPVLQGEITHDSCRELLTTLICAKSAHRTLRLPLKDEGCRRCRADLEHESDARHRVRDIVACWIEFREQRLLLNNMQFRGLIQHVIEVGSRTSRMPAERMFVERMAQLNKEEFWPGRGIQIENDFPDIEEQKFWARVFCDTARAIFDREVGNHEHSCWQAQTIHQAYGAGQLFEEAVRSQLPGWHADTIDSREFDRSVNKRRNED